MPTLLFPISKKQAGTRFVDMSKEKMFKIFSPKVSKFIYNTGEFFKRSDGVKYVSDNDNKKEVWESFLKIYPSLCTTYDLAKVFVAVKYFYEYDPKNKTVKIELDNPSKQMENISEKATTLESIVVSNEMKENVASAMKKVAQAIKKTKKEKWQEAMEYIKDYLLTGQEGEYSDMTSSEAMKERTKKTTELMQELQKSKGFQAKKQKHDFTAQNADISEGSKENISISQPPPERPRLDRKAVAKKVGERAKERVSKMRETLKLTKTKRRGEDAPAPLEPPRPFEVPEAMKKAERKKK